MTKSIIKINKVDGEAYYIMLTFANEKWKWLKKIVSVSFYIAFFCLMVIVIFEKKNLHIDEVYTYILSNNTYTDGFNIDPVSGQRYDRAEEPWLQVMTPQKGSGQFNYANVWKKQGEDVHPPLYYALVHTVCSFFPGTYSPWFAASVNMLFALLTLCMVRRLTFELTHDESSIFFVSCFFIASAGVLSSVSFFRMYVMTMFCVTLVSWLFLRAREERTPRFYLEIVLASILGALTHYYFIIWLFFITLFFGIYLLISHKWKDACLLVAAMAVSGGISILIFPKMLDHIFGNGYRGQQSFTNFYDSSGESYRDRLRDFYRILDGQLFGGLFVKAIGLGLLVALFILIIKRKGISRKEFREKVFPYVMIGGPCILYFLLVSKIAVYIVDRYFHPIYPILIVLTVSFLSQVARKITFRKLACVALCFLLLVLTLKEWRLNRPYLYKHSRELLNQAVEHADLDCILIYSTTGEVNLAFYEVRNYNSSMFFQKEDIYKLSDIEFDSSRGFIAIIANSCNMEETLEFFLETFPDINAEEYLGSFINTTSYYLYVQ